MKDHPNTPYGICETREQCAALKQRGVAAIKPHPAQFDGRGQMVRGVGEGGGVCARVRVVRMRVCARAVRPEWSRP